MRWPAAQPTQLNTPPKPISRFRRVLLKMITGAADVDPALVITATVAGALFRYSLLWSVLLSVPILVSVFAVSARIGSETKRGLMDLLRGQYGRALALICAAIVLSINMTMIVADLMAVTDAFSIIIQLPRMFFIAATAFAVWHILIFRDYRRVTRILAILALPLLIYVAAAVLAHPNWPRVIRHSIVPTITGGSGYPAAVLAIFGSLLTPYVLVWQTSSRRTELRAEAMSTEHRAGVIVTTVLCYAIMVAAGALLQVTHVGDLTTRMAAEALTPALGPLATVLFALGLIGAGMVALPVLIASMCYSVSEAMGWPSGLNENPWEAKRFFGMISGAVFIAGALNFVRINPVVVLYWSQILAGILALPILGFILLVSNDHRLMRTTNTWWQNFWIGAGCGAVLCAILLAFGWKFLQ
ncbi:MAG: divalent metal cation transporter [Candidatus Angelobacter sp.]